LFDTVLKLKVSGKNTITKANTLKLSSNTNTNTKSLVLTKTTLTWK